jgi:predicted transcriptional regulator
MLAAPNREYSRAEPTHLPKASVFQLAESVASDLRFEPGADIHDIVQVLGGRVEVQDLLLEEPEHCGTLYVDGPESFKIIVPSHTSPLRDRFTIAHELGHFFLHYLFSYDEEELANKALIAYRKDSDRVEWEANWFAAAFLMPEGAFRQEYIRLHGHVDRLADYFRVSTAAAKIRAKDLGLVP